MPYSYEKFLIELGTRIRQARKDRGWTMRDMIVLHGFHLSQWQNFEKGKAISVPSLLRICDVYAIDLEELVQGIGKLGTAAPMPDAGAGKTPPAAKSRPGRGN